MGRWITGVLSVFALFVIANGYAGWRDAHLQAPALVAEAASLIATGRGPDQLAPDQIRDILNTHDPYFYQHNGIYVRHSRLGTATLTQRLAEPIVVAGMIPGIHVISGTTYALALDERLPKPAQLALFLNQIDMGPGPDGTWVRGFFDAAQIVFGKTARDLSQTEFSALLEISAGRSGVTLADLSAQPETQVAKIKLPANQP